MMCSMPEESPRHDRHTNRLGRVIRQLQVEAFTGFNLPAPRSPGWPRQQNPPLPSRASPLEVCGTLALDPCLGSVQRCWRPVCKTFIVHRLVPPG